MLKTNLHNDNIIFKQFGRGGEKSNFTPIVNLSNLDFIVNKNILINKVLIVEIYFHTVHLQNIPYIN